MSDTPDTDFLRHVGSRLRHVRTASGLNLHQLARLTGVSAPALSLIETGKRDPRLTTLARIATALRLPLSDLLEPNPSTQPDGPPDEGGYDLGDYT